MRLFLLINSLGTHSCTSRDASQATKPRWLRTPLNARQSSAACKILHYHADNGRFTDNAFIADCNVQQQNLLYCGVNAHFRNDIAEHHIRDLQEQTRTSMLYAMNKWKRMILICLWAYTMRHANDVTNATPQHCKRDVP